MPITGLIAVILLFLAGPYRTMQTRWPGRWGPKLPVWAHSNISVAAAIMVAVHLAQGARGLGPFQLLTWIATTFFVIAMVSGTFGLLFTKKPSRRRHWLRFHRVLTNILYLSIIPHVVVKGFFGWPAGVLVPAIFLLWKYNAVVTIRLRPINWPLHKAKRTKIAMAKAPGQH